MGINVERKKEMVYRNELQCFPTPGGSKAGDFLMPFDLNEKKGKRFSF